MAEIPQTELLPEIDAALADSGWRIRIPHALRAGFEAEQDRQRRPWNRLVVALLIIFFDSFWFMEVKSAPEILTLSAILRFGILTPAMAAFLSLDRFGRLGKLYDLGLLVLALMPEFFSDLLFVNTISPSALPDARATTLILLTTGLMWRAGVRIQIANVILSFIAYSASISASVFVPPDELPSMIMTEVCIGAAVIVFCCQMQARDRRIFLLHTAEKIYRAQLAAHNTYLLKQTQTDALTGVGNRRCFDDTLAAVWQECLRNNHPITLLMIDIDHFKNFNDHYGHQGGDECLGRVARKIRAQVRSSDLVARYGGEEFAVIMPGASLDRGRTLAERICRAIADMALPHAGAGPNAVVTISLGVASRRPTAPDSARVLIEQADHALYEAKRGGRNRVCVNPGEIDAATAHAA